MKTLRIFTLLLLLPATSYQVLAESASDAVESGDPEAVTKTLVWPDGTRYVGGVADGKRSGKGTIFWQDGTRFVGQFENDMRNGPGTMILPDGTVYTGFFEDDELVDTESTIAASNAESVAMDPEDSMDVLDDASLPMEADSLSDAEQPEPVEEVAQVDEYDTLEGAPADDYEEVVEDVIETTAEIEDSTEEIAEAIAAEETLEAPYSTDVTEIAEAVKDELIETVDLWAAAWSDQNVPQYLANYSDDFAVPGRQSRRTWEALRRTRLTRPRYINLDVEYQRFELVEANVVDVFFRQTYSSNTYSDLTDKVLRLRKEDDTNWKILVERSR